MHHNEKTRESGLDNGVHYTSRIGWTGVDLFFVLSGFLIGSLLFNELQATGTINVRRFLVRRGLKIWPSYYLLIAYVFCVQVARLPIALKVTGMPVRDSVWSAFKGIAANLLHIQNYVGSIRLHTWSLAVEEHFYLLLPFALLVLTRRARATRDWSRVVMGIPALGLVLIVGCNLVHFEFVARTGTGTATTHSRIDELFVGVLLAYANCSWPGFLVAVRRHRLAIGGMGGLFLALAAVFAMGDGRFRFPIVVLAVVVGYAAILMTLIATPLGEGWLGRAMNSYPARAVAWIGTYSYSIYLWHGDFVWGPLGWLYSSGGFGTMRTSRTWVICSFFYVLGAVVVGAGMTRLVEVPVLKFRERFSPRPVPVLTRDEAAASGETLADRDRPDSAKTPRPDLVAS